MFVEALHTKFFRCKLQQLSLRANCLSGTYGTVDKQPNASRRCTLTTPWASASGKGDASRGREAHGGRKPQVLQPSKSNSTVTEQGEPTTRLNKRMADLGICSRREADEWISKGWVRVNGKAVELGQRVTATDIVEVANQARDKQHDKVTILINKPVGYVSGQAEDGYLPAVSLVEARSHWAEDRNHMRRFNAGQLRGIAPAGRLDIDSTGLLVLTQDGRVARQIIGEDSDVDKEYLVRVQYIPKYSKRPPPGSQQPDVQSLFPAEKLKLLNHGLSLDGVALKPAEVTWQNPEQLRFVLREGKKRQIRRMCEAVGLTVVGLKRVRIGRVMLGSLPPGQWRYLAEGEEF